MIYLSNAISVHMLPHLKVGTEKDLHIRRISSYEASDILKSGAFRSFYGHGKSAYHLARYLKLTIPISRGYIELQEGDVLIVAAITGKRAWEAGVKPFPGWIFFEVTASNDGRDETALSEQAEGIE